MKTCTPDRTEPETSATPRPFRSIAEARAAGFVPGLSPAVSRLLAQWLVEDMEAEAAAVEAQHPG